VTSLATSTVWEALGAILLATIVVLWTRSDRRRRRSAITAAKGQPCVPVRQRNSQSPNAQWRIGSELDKTAKPISLEVRVLKEDGKFILLIPLEAGGYELVKSSRGISQIAGADLKVTIPEWLGDKMGLEEGDLVLVNNDDGVFGLAAIEASPEYTRRN
jgi:hypothetical protein